MGPCVRRDDRKSRRCAWYYRPPFPPLPWCVRPAISRDKTSGRQPLLDECRPESGVGKRADLVHVTSVGGVASVISDRVGIGPLADVERVIDSRELTGPYRSRVLRLG